MKPKIHRKFWHVAIDDIDKSNPHGPDNIPRSSKFHSIYGTFPTDPTTLMVWDLMCFCPTCFKKQWEGCLNKAHVLLWWVIKLIPGNTYDALPSSLIDSNVSLK